MLLVGWYCALWCWYLFGLHGCVGLGLETCGVGLFVCLRYVNNVGFSGVVLVLFVFAVAVAVLIVVVCLVWCLFVVATCCGVCCYRLMWVVCFWLLVTVYCMLDFGW